MFEESQPAYKASRVSAGFRMWGTRTGSCRSSLGNPRTPVASIHLITQTTSYSHSSAWSCPSKSFCC